MTSNTKRYTVLGSISSGNDDGGAGFFYFCVCTPFLLGKEHIIILSIPQSPASNKKVFLNLISKVHFKLFLKFSVVTHPQRSIK